MDECIVEEMGEGQYYICIKGEFKISQELTFTQEDIAAFKEIQENMNSKKYRYKGHCDQIGFYRGQLTLDIQSINQDNMCTIYIKDAKAFINNILSKIEEC